ncbi:MAG TPA: DUF2062 domain-containing protein [Thermoanaerobaculia bacterium]|nr:DUF2062 domain-containing protein [Thermoanaerobaculia bacterium]
MRGRRDARRRLQDLHVRLRTEGGTPVRRALAVGLGTFIGVFPVYGLHLALSTIAARVLRLNRGITYFAANINNPFTLPFLLWIEARLGHWLLTGTWPPVSLENLRDLDLLDLGRDILLGSTVLGLVLGGALAALTWVLGGRTGMDREFADLREAAAEPYLEAGIRHWEFVRGKLRFDPVYRQILDLGLLPRPGTLVDLGCGRGILLALLSAPVEEWRSTPPEQRSRPAAPTGMELHGIELAVSAVRVARRALRAAAKITRADLAQCEVPPCSTAVLLDVLHYLPAETQEDLLARTARALGPRGLLIVREADAAAGGGFGRVRLAERLRALSRGHWRQRFHYRTRGEWEELLERHGLEVDSVEGGAGTPFANVLLLARRRPRPGTPPATSPQTLD